MAADLAPVCECHGVPKLWQKDAELTAGGRWRCRVDAQEAGRESKRRYRATPEGREAKRLGNHEYKDRKRAIVDLTLYQRGGHCVWPGCSETEGLHWHHRDPAEKAFQISEGVTENRWSPQALIEELRKCDPLCSPHHVEADRALREVAS